MSEPQKILVVDDDPDVLFAVQAHLEQAGYRVLVAKTGMEAMQRVQFDKPDLIILDLMIERHDTGFTVAKSIKTDPATRDIPIIMVSAVREKTGFAFSQERDGHWMKTSVFLEKPYDPDVALQKIRELLPPAK
jgi:CheY-like chemotaxis protein